MPSLPKVLAPAASARSGVQQGLVHPCVDDEAGGPGPGGGVEGPGDHRDAALAEPVHWCRRLPEVGVAAACVGECLDLRGQRRAAEVAVQRRSRREAAGAPLGRRGDAEQAPRARGLCKRGGEVLRGGRGAVREQVELAQQGVEAGGLGLLRVRRERSCQRRAFRQPAAVEEFQRGLQARLDELHGEGLLAG